MTYRCWSCARCLSGTSRPSPSPPFWTNPSCWSVWLILMRLSICPEIVSTERANFHTPMENSLSIPFWYRSSSSDASFHCLLLCKWNIMMRWSAHCRVDFVWILLLIQLREVLLWTRTGGFLREPDSDIQYWRRLVKDCFFLCHRSCWSRTCTRRKPSTKCAQDCDPY